MYDDLSSCTSLFSIEKYIEKMKMRNFKDLLASFLLCGFLVLNSAYAAKVVVKNPGKISYSKTNVVLRVNGISITEADYSNRIEMVCSLAKIKAPKVPDEKLVSYKKKLRTTEFKVLAQRMAVNSVVLSKSRITNDVNVVSSVKARYVKSFLPKENRKQKQIRKSVGERFDELVSKVDQAGYRDLFLRDYEFDVKLDSYFTQHCSDKLNVTDQEISEAKANVAEYNKMATATNSLQEKICGDIIKLARSGHDFTALIKKYSQSVEENAGMPEECTQDDFSDEPGYWDALLKLKEGEVSDLLTTSEGYEIVRLNKVLSPNDSQSGSKALNISKIFRRKAYLFPEQSDEEFAQDIKNEKIGKFNRTFVREAVNQAKIEFPSGMLHFTVPKQSTHKKSKEKNKKYRVQEFRIVQMWKKDLWR